MIVRKYLRYAWALFFALSAFTVGASAEDREILSIGTESLRVVVDRVVVDRVVVKEAQPQDSAATVVFVFEGALAPSATVFEVENPRRIVVDFAPTQERVNRKPKQSLPLIRQYRFGVHNDKARFVIELLPDIPVTYESKKGADSLTLRFAPARTVARATESPTPTSSVIPPPDTPPFTPTVIATATPATTRTVIATATPTTTPTVMATVTPTPSVPPLSTPAVVEGRALTNLEFLTDDGQSAVELRLTERSQFRLTRERDRRFRLTIPGCSVASEGLKLPHFPPDDVPGFTLVQARSEGDAVEVLIGVDDGMKAVAVNRENSIVVRAIPAGF